MLSNDNLRRYIVVYPDGNDDNSNPPPSWMSLEGGYWQGVTENTGPNP